MRIDFRKNVQTKAENFDLLIQELGGFMDDWQDDPKWLSGWRHNYFCDQDGTFLNYEPSQPKEHRCTTCGKIYTDQKKNNAWVTITRNKTISAMRYATVLYLKTDQQRYLDFVKKTLLFYAQNYNEFPVHIKNTILTDMGEYERVQGDIEKGLVYFDPRTTDWLFADYEIQFQGPGKIMAQGLSEAIALIRMLFCYTVLQEEFEEEEKEQLVEQLIRPARIFLKQQQFIAHNITLWRETAIQIMDLITGEFSEEQLQRPYGIYEHLKTGLTKDGFWYEGSVHYHHYVLEALSYLAYFMMLYEKKDQYLEESITEMAMFSYHLAFETGIFPNPNDGWPNVNLKTYLNVFELAAAAYEENHTLQDIYQAVKQLAIPRQPLPIEDELYLENSSTTGVLINCSKRYTKQIEKGTKHFTNSKLSVLRNRTFNIFMKYGVLSLSHAHFDPYSIEFTVKDELFSKDLSNVGYGSELVHRWYNTPLGHNSIIIDEQFNNILYHSALEEASDTSLTVRSNDIYEDTQVSRSIDLKERRFTVCSKVKTKRESTIDIVQHFDKESLVIINGENLSEAREIPLYKEHLNEEIVHSSNKMIDQNTLDLRDNETRTTIHFNSERPFTVYIMKTVGNPSNEERLTLIFRFENQKQAALNMIVETLKENGNDQL
ncbi:heparinase II/III domain-containing protein [Candidatus Enterococcus clewellii]|uniref:Heparinase II/III-like C-terminal domain-containing protein n=1 Tax=Candidatus Enterococcus clewellii TaxID=1834193 RepID=A0A242K3T2_9ENTE|nr:heparinase II/III family protein [Enterococcus sp. 9E7_DIV0242]OTP11696.1 hypothetical protein A5888_003795 [Enterococcus sp. 9E7_DIV0242]